MVGSPVKQVNIYFNDYYMYTTWANQAHAVATGTADQAVVRTLHGKITWIPNYTGIVIADVSRRLQAHITTGFEPRGPQTDMARHYNRGRILVHIANMLHNQ